MISYRLHCAIQRASAFVDKNDSNRMNNEDEFREMKLREFLKIETIGEGAFGKVYLVKSDRNRKTYALKAINKRLILNKKQQAHVISERNIQMSCDCNFIVRLHRTYRDNRSIYLLMEYCIGGELWKLIKERGRFDELTTRYYCAAALEALQYLHNRSIVYRDLKPENMLLQLNGTPKLTDFGFSKILGGNGGKTWTFCGTTEYLAPEVILNKGHDTAVDIWALGIFLYELLTGMPPFTSSSSEKIYRTILIGFDQLLWPKYISNDVISLIRNLCCHNFEQRLGYRNIDEIRSHRWFSTFNFESFRNSSMTPPIVPTMSSADIRSDNEYIVSDETVNFLENTWDSQF